MLLQVSFISVIKYIKQFTENVMPNTYRFLKIYLGLGLDYVAQDHVNGFLL